MPIQKSASSLTSLCVTNIVDNLATVNLWTQHIGGDQRSQLSFFDLLRNYN